jgi:hypothetical protein
VATAAAVEAAATAVVVEAAKVAAAAAQEASAASSSAQPAQQAQQVGEFALVLAYTAPHVFLTSTLTLIIHSSVVVTARPEASCFMVHRCCSV